MTLARRDPHRLARLAALATLTLVLWLAPRGGRADDPPIINERETHYDYYSADTNPDARRYLALAEQYHLTNTTFWEEYRLKSWVRARNELVFILRITPNHPKVLYLLEAVAAETEDVSYPIAYYEYALRVYPQHAITRARYGRYLARIGKRDAGIEQLEEALAADSTLVVARGWLADAVANRISSEPRQLPAGQP